MSRNTIDIIFADGEYTFSLPAPRIEELQRKTGIGIGAMFKRLLAGVLQIGDKVFLDPNQAEFYYADIVETIRQGLIGGGRGVVNGEEVKVTPPLAEQLMKNYVLDRPIGDSWSLAATIVGACIHGYDPPKKEEPGLDPGVAPKKKSGAKKKAGSTTASS
jgi:hypothetical protein